MDGELVVVVLVVLAVVVVVVLVVEVSSYRAVVLGFVWLFAV